MLTLGQIETSEYNLLGAMSEDDFMQALELSGPNDKKRLFRKMQTQSRAVATAGGSRSRAEFEKRISLLPKEIQMGLANQSLQAVDTAYYGVKLIGGSKVIKMFKDDDNKVVGTSNISSGKLEKGNHFLLYGIQLLGAVGDSDTAQGTVNYDVVPDYIRNGEFEFKANGTVLIPNTSCEVFQTTGKDTFKGLFGLDNPKIIRDQQSIEFNMDWASNAPAHSFLKVILRGTAVIKS